MSNNELLKCAMPSGANDDDPELHLGQWLEEFDIGASEAAEIAGCTQSYISNMIGGRKTNINVLYLLRLSNRMDVTVNDFYRPLPSKSSLSSLKNLSPKAQATLLARQAAKR